jgi:ElaB/YqjD/DUF883 family membrane-anchored ribosome-binding protein
MVDNTNQISASSQNDDRLAEEIARLKSEIANLKDALAGRADDLIQGASNAAQAVVQPVRNNPGTFGLIAGGLIGLLVGLAIGQAEQQRSRHWYDRYR